MMKTVIKEFVSTVKEVVGAHIYEVPGKTIPVLVLKDGQLPKWSNVPSEIQG